MYSVSRLFGRSFLLASLVLLGGCQLFGANAPGQVSRIPTATALSLPTPTPFLTLQHASLAGLTFYETPYILGVWPDPHGPYWPRPADYDGPRDASGVRVYFLKGVTYQHPVEQGQDGLWALAVYSDNHDPSQLALAEKEGQRLIDTHISVAATGDAWWFPYRFVFALYGDPADTNKPPWYSGMAQGIALELFSQLYAVTGNSLWSNAAQHTFDSFLYPLLSSVQRFDVPWVWHLDNGYAWIEEWPTPYANDHTMNGFGFALWGLIDYAHIFHDARAVTLADGGLTTYLAAASLVRRPGGISSYSLSHPWDQNAYYHGVVTYQLATFAAVTGDQRFATLAAAFYNDHH